MATDATGTPTVPDSIPTYNTSVDAPSGLGFNAAMAQIQVALSARPKAPAGIASGEAMVWNGASWDRSSVTRVGPTSLGTGTPDNTKFLRGDGAWVVPTSAVTYRKNSATAVNTTVAATDLLAGAITVAAGAMGTTGIVRLTAEGDWINNSGTNGPTPRFQLVFGGTTLLDTNVGGNLVAGAIRYPWKIVAEITNLGATNSQAATLLGNIAFLAAAATVGGVAFTTGEGVTNYIAGGSGTMQGFNTGALDTTTSKTLVLNVINPVSNALCETKLYRALVEVI